METPNPEFDKAWLDSLSGPKESLIDKYRIAGKNIQPDTMAEITTYQPETIAIPTQELRKIVDALEAGLEHTQTVLSEHDASLGRTTRKNKNWAESLEKDIEFSKNLIKMLKLKLTGVTTHYP